MNLVQETFIINVSYYKILYPCATKIAVEACGKAAGTGTLETGKKADILIVKVTLLKTLTRWLICGLLCIMVL
jgi:cytosine/adenosine deaminase-related metal-dependent hydrolase